MIFAVGSQKTATVLHPSKNRYILSRKRFLWKEPVPSFNGFIFVQLFLVLPFLGEHITQRSMLQVP